MTKTLVRACASVDRLRQAWYHIDTTALQFDTIQIVLMDRPEGYIHIVGACKDDRLFQVEVGADGLPCELGQEEDFTLGLARIVQRAISELSIPQDTREEMRNSINQQTPNKPAHPTAGNVLL